MQANLSIVLDKDMVVRLDLLKDLPISEIDKYTTKKSSSNEIREEFKDEIEAFLEEQKDFTATFKKEGNKKGSLVIVYEDENERLHRMRVLYKENKKKTDTNHILKEVFRAIRETSNPYFSIDLINYFDFFLGSEYDKRQISKIFKYPSNNPTIRSKQNQRLVNLIRNHVKYALEQNPERGYFYLRLIDAYVEKKGIQTTKRVIDSKSGTIVLNKVPQEKTKVVRKKKPVQEVIVEQESVEEKPEDNIFLEDDDGQYSFFELIGSNQQEKGNFRKYEHFLDGEVEKRGKR